MISRPARGQAWHPASSQGRGPRPPGLSLAQQAEADVAWGAADGAAARPRVPDKVRQVAAMAALDDPNPAIGDRLRRRIEVGALKTAAGPFPDIAGEIEEAVFVGAKAADRLDRLAEPLVAACILVVERKRAAAGIGRWGKRCAIVPEAAAGGVGPFLIAWQAEVEAGGARQPRRVGFGIAPADLDDRAVGVVCVGIEGQTGLGRDAALIVRTGDLVAHHQQRPGDMDSDDRRRQQLAALPKLTGGAIAKRSGWNLHQLRNGRWRWPPAAGRCEGGDQAGRDRRCGRRQRLLGGWRAALGHQRRPSILTYTQWRSVFCTGPGALTWLIKSSFQLPSMRKCAVAPSSKASIMLWLT